MATMAGVPPVAVRERFFLISAILMTAVMVGGFSLQLASGRSSFHVPIRVHIHAVVFFGWVMLYLLQNVLAGTGALALHRRLGWLSLAWIPVMVVMGPLVTIMVVREGTVPFFFQPAYFLIMDPMTVFTFAGLAIASLIRRRQTDWHRRLMFCGMTILLGPGIGRALPVPLFIPYVDEVVAAVSLLFPIAGVIRDWRVRGQVHPAWWWGIGTIVAMQAAINLLVFSPVGPALYAKVAAGSPGAQVAPLAFGVPHH